MADIVVIGGGMGGLSTALLLAGDGHDVTVLERDPAPPPAAADAAWDDWDRKGVNQFRMIHYFLPRFRQIVEAELPDVVKALDADGVLRFNPVMSAPDFVTGGYREGDERFEALTGRRPMVEGAFARVADATPGVTVRRGTAVQAPARPATPSSPASRTWSASSPTPARRSGPTWWSTPAAAGRPCPACSPTSAPGPPSRSWRTRGSCTTGATTARPTATLPVALGPPLQPYDSFSVLTLPADNGTWGMGIITSAGDAAMRPAKDTATWEAIVSGCPLVAHWLDGEPLTDVEVMAKIEDRHRVLRGRRRARGHGSGAGGRLVGVHQPVGRPGRLHRADPRPGPARPDPRPGPRRPRGVRPGLARRHRRARSSPTTATPSTLDRHRLAEIEAQIAGVPYETDDPAYAIGQAMQATMGQDPDIFRGFIDIATLLARPDEVLGRPGLLDRVIELSQASTPEPLPGPSRARAARDHPGFGMTGNVTLEVDRQAFGTTRLVRADLPALGEGQVRLRVDDFAVTANNITYAAIGEMLGYWDFFPTGDPAWGRVPAMGWATVVETAHPEVPTGGHYYGWYPMAALRRPHRRHHRRGDPRRRRPPPGPRAGVPQLRRDRPRPALPRHRRRAPRRRRGPPRPAARPLPDRLPGRPVLRRPVLLRGRRRRRAVGLVQDRHRLRPAGLRARAGRGDRRHLGGQCRLRPLAGLLHRRGHLRRGRCPAA